MLLRGFVLFLTSAMFLFFSAQTLFAKDVLYTVQPGDTLSTIAEKHYDGQTRRWADIYRANKDLIKNADVIEPGWDLTIPDVDQKKAPPVPASKAELDIIPLVTGNDYPPFSDSDLPSKGMVTEIVNEAFSRMDKPVKIEWWAWQRAYDATLQGTFVATFPWLKSEKRLDKFFYSRPLAEIEVLGFVRNDSELEYEKRSDLYGQTFCKEKGYFTHDIDDLVESGKSELVYVEPERVQDCFEKLQQGEVDIVTLGELIADGLFKKYGYENKFRSLDKPVHVDTLHLIFSKNQEFALRNLKILHDFNQAVDAMDSEGELQEIQKKHIKWHYLLN